MVELNDKSIFSIKIFKNSKIISKYKVNFLPEHAEILDFSNFRVGQARKKVINLSSPYFKNQERTMFKNIFLHQLKLKSSNTLKNGWSTINWKSKGSNKLSIPVKIWKTFLHFKSVGTEDSENGRKKMLKYIRSDKIP